MCGVVTVQVISVPVNRERGMCELGMLAVVAGGAEGRER